jgi:hypothetical protein
MDWAQRLRLDEGNVRQAVRWHFAHDITPLPRVFRILWLDWQLRDRMPEGHAWLEQLMARADALDDKSHLQLLLIAAVTESDVGNDETTLAIGQRLEAMRGRIDDPYLEAAIELVLSWNRTTVDDLAGAMQAANRALEGFRRQDELGVGGFAPFITPSALLTLGMLEMTAARQDEARGHLREVVAQGDRFGNTFLGSSGRAQLASLAVSVDDLVEARRLLTEALDVPDDDELSTHPLSFCLVAMARLQLAHGDARRAAVALGAAHGLRERAGLTAWASARQVESQIMAAVQQALGPARYDEAFAEGVALTRVEAIALVRGAP